MTRRPALGLAALVLLAGCTSTVPRTAGWQSVPVPQHGARVVVLSRLGNALLALGSVPGPAGRAPAGWTTADGRHWHALRLTPVTGYGQVAEFVMAGVAGDHVAAYGQAFGGAHSNARPTLWSGDAQQLAEHEQVFTMFGGEDAISVNGEAARPGTVLLVGAWDAASGRYGAAVWTSPDGAAWTRYADAPNLASAPGEQTAAYGAAATDDGFLVVGTTLRQQGAAVRNAALAWTSRDAHTWQRTVLASPTSAMASRAACDAVGCIVLGSTVTADQHLLCWPADPAGSPSAAARPGPGHGLVDVLSVQLHGASAYAVSAADHVARLDTVGRDCTGWRQVALPERAQTAAVGFLPGHVLLATTGAGASRLWLRAG